MIRNMERGIFLLILAVYILIAWCALTIFLINPLKLPLPDNLFLFFCVTILSINYFTIVDLNLKLIKTKKSPDLFLCLWLHRTTIIPLCIVLFTNVYYRSKTLFTKHAAGIAVFLALSFIEILTVWLDLKSYNGWNFFYSTVTIAFLMFSSNLLLELFQKFGAGETTTP